MRGAIAMRPGARAHVPVALAAVGCLVVAAASLALRAGPQYDPVGWLIWGRELLHGQLNTVWYPSWKPLPVLVTTPAALAGHGALTLWMLVERATALAGVVAAARIAWRTSGPVAGVLAAAAVVTLPAWIPLWLRGTIEPVVAAAVIGAVAAGLARRPMLGLVLLAVAALGRVDAWPLLVLATLWSWRDRRARVAGAALAVLVPALWLAGDWAGSSDPTHGGFLARIAGRAHEDVGVPPVLAVLHHVPQMVPPPLLAVAVAAGAWGVARRRGAETMLAAVAVTWLVTDLLMAWRGYPTDLRFLLPPAAACAALAAIGVGRALAALPDPRLARAVAAACLVVAVAVRAPAVHDEVTTASVAYDQLGRLDTAVAWAGGEREVAACGGAATTQPFRARLAWNLERSTAAVVAVGRSGLVFLPPGVGPRRLPIRRHAAVRLRRIARVAGWTILRVTPRDGPARTGCSPGPRVQAQRSVLGSSRMRSTRAGTPPTTALAGTSPVTTA
jgi:hypothetical protein